MPGAPALDAGCLLQPFSPLTRRCRCTDTWTLVARVFVSRIDGHWAQKSGHSGSCPRRQCPPSDSATWASPGAERAVTPISHAYSNLLIAPFFPVSPETTCAETPWARPSSARHSLSRVHLCLLPILPPLRTPVPLSASLLGATLQWGTKESRGSTSTFLPFNVNLACDRLETRHLPPHPPHNNRALSLFSFYIASSSIIFLCTNSHIYCEHNWSLPS